MFIIKKEGILDNLYYKHLNSMETIIAEATCCFDPKVIQNYERKVSFIQKICSFICLAA